MAYYVDVILPIAVNQKFTYIISKDEYDFIKPGLRIIVPFGKSKIYTSIVVEKHNLPPLSYEAKPIDLILDEKPLLFDYQIKFWKWIADYYHCSFGQVMRASIPSTLLLESETRMIINSEVKIDKNSLSDEQFLIYEALEKSILKIDDLIKISGNKNPIKL